MSLCGWMPLVGTRSTSTVQTILNIVWIPSIPVVLRSKPVQITPFKLIVLRSHYLTRFVKLCTDKPVTDHF